jgi:hypothetical protein
MSICNNLLDFFKRLHEQFDAVVATVVRRVQVALPVGSLVQALQVLCVLQGLKHSENV